MNWYDLLKRGTSSLGSPDIRMIDYVMQDGVPKTMDAIMDEIYDNIIVTKKISGPERTQRRRVSGKPSNTKFNGTLNQVKSYFIASPNYERENVGKDEYGRVITEFRYVGPQ